MEDHPPDVFLVKEALRQWRIECDLKHVTDGDTALAFLSSENAPKPALVILDLSLPRLDGFTVLQHIRQQKKYKKVPVLVLTSSSRDVDRARAIQLGASAFVTKPDSIDVYFERVGGNIAKLLRTAADEEVQAPLFLDLQWGFAY